MVSFLFFFSSRRRHTRLVSDWSSDVCYSDLGTSSGKPDAKCRAQLFGSGAILPEVIKAAEILESKYNVGADVWSVTSYSELYREGHACERWNMLHPSEAAQVPYVTRCLKDAPGVFIAASDYVKALPDS